MRVPGIYLLLLSIAVASPIGIRVAADAGVTPAGPELEVLSVGKAYVGKAYGTPDSAGETGSIFQGYSFKVHLSAPLDKREIDIVSGERRIGEVGDEVTR